MDGTRFQGIAMTLRIALLAIVFIGSALAQTSPSYDPDRSCRYYVLRHLPVPVRCMADLLGNWSPKPYIDAGFMFRNREEWLAWKDRDDYRRWKAHDFTGQLAAPSVTPRAAPVASSPATAALFCPSEITVRASAIEGWSGNDVVVPREGMPRVDTNTLICTYGRITISRPAWGRCTVRSDGTGFDCSP
jgi:hypothetical protein